MGGDGGASERCDVKSKEDALADLQVQLVAVSACSSRPPRHFVTRHPKSLS